MVAVVAPVISEFASVMLVSPTSAAVVLTWAPGAHPMVGVPAAAPSKAGAALKTTLPATTVTVVAGFVHRAGLRNTLTAVAPAAAAAVATIMLGFVMVCCSLVAPWTTGAPVVGLMLRMAAAVALARKTGGEATVVVVLTVPRITGGVAVVT